jgi:phenylalanyl-tRNA synthetase beta chain
MLPGEVVEIVNPLSEDQRYLRFSLVPGLLALARRYANALPLRFFELGHIFFDAPELVERATVTWMFATSKPADQPEWRDDDFLRFKGESLALIRALSGREADTLVAAPLELHPGKSASLQIDGREVATIGAVDPRLLAAFDVESAVYIGSMRIEALPAYSVPTYQAPSKYPALERDLALIVAPEVGAGQIESAIRAGADGVLAGVRVFDEYRGPQVEAGKKSLAVRVVLQRDDATLTDTEAEQHVAAILAALAERCGAKIRQ